MKVPRPLLNALVGAAFAACLASCSSSTPSSANETTTIINYAPAGSSQSFADGYNSSTRLCLKQGWTSCAVKLARAQPNATAASWCSQTEQDPAIYGGPPPRDDRSQWLQGCIASFGSASTSATTVPPTSPIPTTTTTTTPPITPAQQKFVTDIENQFPGVSGAIAAGADDGTFTTQTLAEEGQEICGALSGIPPNDVSAPTGSEFANPYGRIVSDVLTGTFGSPGGTGGPFLDIPTVSQTLPNSEIEVSLSIEDICPQYLSDIPPGDPGAS